MARASKEIGQSLDTRVAFRLSRQDYETYKAKVSEAGLTASEFFRKAVLENRTEIVVMSPEVRELVYHFNKIGNNLNQLTKRINEDNLAGRLDPARYDWLLVHLVAVADYLKELVPHDRPV
jgi:hypothetical protein